MTEMGRGRSAVLLMAVGVGIAIFSFVAEDIGLGSRNGIIGTWQRTGIVIGLAAVVVSIAWLSWPRVSRAWSSWRWDLIRRAAAGLLVLAMAGWLALIVFTDHPCPDCLDPSRPYSYSCGPEWNPTTFAPGHVELGCSGPEL